MDILNHCEEQVFSDLVGDCARVRTEENWADLVDEAIYDASMSLGDQEVLGLEHDERLKVSYDASVDYPHHAIEDALHDYLRRRIYARKEEVLHRALEKRLNGRRYIVVSVKGQTLRLVDHLYPESVSWDYRFKMHRYDYV
jgi:hypothetical protein